VVAEAQAGITTQRLPLSRVLLVDAQAHTQAAVAEQSAPMVLRPRQAHPARPAIPHRVAQAVAAAGRL
jgi:hypothetical protein